MLCLAILFSLCGCKDGKSVIDSISNLGKQDQPALKDEIGFTIPYMRTDSLDPFSSTETMNRYVASLLFDPLYTLNSSFSPVGVIAKDSKLSDNKLTVTIKGGLKFTDGSALTSADVVYSFNRAKESTAYIALLENIEQASADGIYNIVFTLKAPDSGETANLTFPIIKELSDKKQDEYDSTDDEDNDNSNSSQTKLPIGSGRYTFVSNSETKYLQYNAQRLGGYTPTYAKIGLADVADTESLQSLFNLQRIDFYCDSFSDGKYAKFSKISSKVELTNFVYLGVNSDSSVLSEPKVRRAIALALDRSVLVSDSFAGCAVATSLPFHPSFYKLKNCTVPTLKNKTDSAVELLESVGYSKIGDTGARYSGDKSLNVTLLVNSENDFRRSLARGIQQSLAKIGILVTIREYSYSDYISAVENESFDLYIGETELSNSFNLSKFFSEDGGLKYGINQKSKSANTYSDYIGGDAEIQQFIDAFSDDLPFIPIAFRQGIAVKSDNIKTDIVTHPNDGFANINEWTAQ